MGAVDKGKLDSKVADDLLMDASVLQLMENPKVSEAIARLKEEPGCFEQMCADDPELGKLPSRNQARHGRPARPSSCLIVRGWPEIGAARGMVGR